MHLLTAAHGHGFTFVLHLDTPKPDIFYQDLRVALGEKEQKLKEVEKEVELWRRKDRALTTVLQEKEAQISFLQTALQEVKRMFAFEPSIRVAPLTTNVLLNPFSLQSNSGRTPGLF